MSVEVLLISYFVWSAIATVVYLMVDEEGLSFAFGACVGSIGAAGPLALILLVDGQWCRNDCVLIASILFPVSFVIFFGRAGSWIASRLFGRSQTEDFDRDPRSGTAPVPHAGSGHSGLRPTLAIFVLLIVLQIMSMVLKDGRGQEVLGDPPSKLEIVAVSPYDDRTLEGLIVDRERRISELAQALEW